MNCVLPGATHRCVDILASVDWRKKTQPKSWEFCLTRWLSVDFKPRVALKGCSKEVREQSGFIGVLQQRPSSHNTKRLMIIKENQISQINEFSAFLYMGRCKSLGSLRSFLWCAPQLSEASILCFFLCWVSSGLTIGSGCSLQAVGWRVFFPSWVPSGIISSPCGGCNCWWLWQPSFTDNGRK